MEKLSYIAVPALVIVGVLSIYLALGDIGGISGLMDAGSGDMAFGAAVTIVVGTFISGGTQAPNWARFASNRSVGFWAGLLAFLVGNGFLFISGAVGGVVYDVTPQGDLFAVLSAQGLALVGLIALVFNIWTTNDNAAYAFGVAGSEAFEFDRKRPFILAGGVIGILLALVGVDNLLVPWLATLGQYIPPLGGVIIADFVVVWGLNRVPRMEDVEFTNVRWVALLSYVAGCVVATLTAGQLIPGVRAPQLIPGMASLNGLVVASIVHVAGHYALERSGVLSGHDVSENTRYL
jgi:cytosine permease